MLMFVQAESLLEKDKLSGSAYDFILCLIDHTLQK